jgi:hypothetical protein
MKIGPWRARAASRVAVLVALAACGSGTGDTSSPPDAGGGGSSVDATADATVDSALGAPIEAGADGPVGPTDATLDADAAGDVAVDGPSLDARDLADTGGAQDRSVLQFHKHASRDGVYVDPAITVANAQKMHLDPSFSATVDGSVYAQPLYVEDGPGGAPAFIVATETNHVYALDLQGAPLWTRSIGSYAAGAEGCGNIKPLGITGTPVIDLTRRAVYLDAAIASPDPSKLTLYEHEVHALSLDDGTELPGGWPVAASTITGVTGAGPGTLGFTPQPQNQRGALLIAGDTLYVPYGGHAGDCADNEGRLYHGWVLGVPLDAPSRATGFATESERAGIWSVGGLASDGRSIFAATGNGNGGQTCPATPQVSPPPGWAQQEAILRLLPGPSWSGQTPDYWAPLDWPCLDNADLDVGGSTPVLLDLPGSTPSHLVVASGKDGYVYVLDRDDLGGVSAPVASIHAAAHQIKMAPAAYTTPRGTYVVIYGSGGTSSLVCPQGQSGNLVAVRITGGSPPAVQAAWCADEMGQGSPIFTSSDGTHDALVWAVGAESSNQLGAWDADTGALVFRGSDVLGGLHHFSTIIVAGGRIFSGADGTMYAYTP